MLIMNLPSYNPKIDYLVCRHLLSNVPAGCDEYHLKKLFQNDLPPQCSHEETLLQVKSFFRVHKAESLTATDAAALYQVVTGERPAPLDKLLCGVSSANDVITLAKSVAFHSASDKDALFKIFLLTGYCRANGFPLITYCTLCRKIFYAVQYGDESYARSFYAALLARTAKYVAKHDVSLNAAALRLICDSASDFKTRFGAIRLGVFGSLVTGESNEYSDADVLAVFPDGVKISKQEAAQYWQRILPVHCDVVTVTQSKFQSDLPIAIRRQVRYV